MAEAGGVGVEEPLLDPFFLNGFIEGIVFLSQTLRQSAFPGRKKNLGGSQRHLVGGLEGVFEAGKLILDPAFTVASEADFLQLLDPFFLFLGVDEILGCGFSGELLW